MQHLAVTLYFQVWVKQGKNTTENIFSAYERFHYLSFIDFEYSKIMTHHR